MSRLLFILAVAVVIYLLIRSFRRHTPGQAGQDKPATEDMVRCAQCGVHLPKSESILEGGNFFCSNEHRNAYRK